jgi:CHASE3 domain sensor protein
MKSMAVRVALLCLFVGTSSAAAYVVWTGESAARREANAARQFEHGAFAIEHDVLDLRAAQQAYVAAGQGDEFWILKAAATLKSARTAIDALRGQASSPDAQASIDNAASALDEFEKIDRRARDYARTGQRLMASDLIFADGLESTGAMLASLNQARTAETQTRTIALTTTRRSEALALAAAAIVGLSIVLVLVPRPRSTQHPSVDSVAENAAPAGFASLDLRPAVEERAGRTDLPIVSAAAPSLDLATVASLCTDLARVVDTHALPALLGRAATVLDAPGIVLWIADPDGRELSPIVTHGYSQKMVTRLGTILKDQENVTAAAFRTSLMQVVDADAVSNGAIAAPLVTPVGCVGVMAAEVRGAGEKDAAKLAAASIVAAQLATLVGPPSTRAQARADAM